MELTNRRQFSMVYTRIDRKMTSKNVQNSSGMGNFFLFCSICYMKFCSSVCSMFNVHIQYMCVI